MVSYCKTGKSSDCYDNYTIQNIVGTEDGGKIHLKRVESEGGKGRGAWGVGRGAWEITIDFSKDILG